ncbi:SRPBCC family protein [Pseudobacteriovorax antillogorgiicola]|uniref:Polyketide cyclase / dehydrase and lipid transport n=1 Tax=Pseudobacteriovorax antillogorgiicola TaxID=1513793 RepID=A0A1Y6C846_9BACT|nr:SRPBCC family protein [Pseudobacteriovorax antillogorgiicola]TCS51801.1 polyketide cyclase/dehydrase/lipid transport protein [Pseudobacteriovorax antillogorgiicola]SMF50083.1 Polyketide cyclase / dehydrase and lipid transport [Pseudobacteriovorax antillogorgiicola]
MLRKPLILMGILSGVFLTILGGITLFGTSLPEEHKVTTQEHLAFSRDLVWQKVSDVEAQASWNPSIASVRLFEENGVQRFEESYSSGEAVTYEIIESEAPHRFVRRVADDMAPFQVTWEIELEEAGPSATTITIQESGTIKNPFIRFISHYFAGHESFQKAYIQAIRRELSKN